MRRKAVSGIMLILLLIGMLAFVYTIQPVKASGTIYIRVDGSVEPDTAPISSVDNVTYIFTGNIYDSIAVEKDNIVLDGAGYTVQGIGVEFSTGIDLSGRSNITVKNTQVTQFGHGIYLSYSSNNTLFGNNITNNNKGVYLSYSSNNSVYENNIRANDKWEGVYLGHSSNNTLSRNNITNNYRGFLLSWSSSNIISGNSITNNYYGVELYCSSNNSLSGNVMNNNTYNLYICGYKATCVHNKFYHNNFLNNPCQVLFGYSGALAYPNFWDDGYPSGGNYWSDYTGSDLYTGPGQNLTEGIGSDGIGDTPYVIDANNTDHYPLMIPWTSNPLIHPQEGQYANYTIRTIDLQTETIQNEDEFNLTYHKYVSPFLMYVTSPKGYGEIYWTALNITNRYAYNCIWPITGIIKDMWFPWLIETNITIGSTIRLLNGTGTVIGDKTLNVNSRIIDCWELACIEEITPETSWEHTFWCHKYTGLLIGQEAIYGSIKVNTTLTDTNIISLLQMPKTWTVDDDGPADFHTIQEAINAANPGDTVFVKIGTYIENVVVNKSLSLVGEDMTTTIINGGQIGNVMRVSADNVNVTDFTITMSGVSFHNCGIELDNAENCGVYRNTLVNNLDGILLQYSSKNSIIGNNVTDNDYGIELTYSSSNNNITGNYVAHNWFGIRLDSPNNSITKNNITNNNYGIWLTSSSNSITSNRLTANDFYGIGLASSLNNSMTGNNITSNQFGIGLFWSSNNNTICGNNIADNWDTGIWCREGSNNIIFHNNFLNNANQTCVTAAYTNVWDNGYPSGGNYWSDHVCTGNPSDGSQPYIIDADNIDHYPFQNLNGWLKVHNIDTQLNYTTIQEAIDASETLDGHTIFVDSGIYYECVVIDKMIHLIGESQLITIIDGWVDVTANGVVISGFAIGGFTAFGIGMTMYFGIRLSGATECRISDNIVFNTERGIWLENSPNNVFSDNLLVANTLFSVYLNEASNNTISQNNITSIELAGGFKLMNYGIEIYRSSNNTIIQNNVTQCQWAIHIEGITYWGEDSSNNKLIENNIENDEWGIALSHSQNTQVIRNNITALATPLRPGMPPFIDADSFGISLYCSLNNSIAQNILECNGEGIRLVDSHLNTITQNNITNNFYGLKLSSSTLNLINQNNITNNYHGILLQYFYPGYYNTFYHNNFINNTYQAQTNSFPDNIWDNGYPSGGNYWSDYNGTDLFRGSYQNETGSDGIGDTPYVIDDNNQDNYPLMKPWPWTPIETSIKVNDKDYPVTIVSNTTIDQITATANTLNFKSSGPTGQKAYINVIFPMVNTTEIKVFIDGVRLTPPPFPVINTNGTHYFIYFEFTLSTHDIAIRFAGMLEDLNDDGVVDIRDIATAALAFGSCPTHPRWNPVADINNDGKVDIRDIALIARNFGKTA